MPFGSKSNGLTKIFKSKPNVADNAGPAPMPGDVPRARKQGQRVSPGELRDLRELIRQRYALDVEIWNLRHVQAYNRDVVVGKMWKADAVLAKIHRTVDSLDDRENFPSDGDYQKFEAIKLKLWEDGKRNWGLNPPWQDA